MSVLPDTLTARATFVPSGDILGNRYPPGSNPTGVSLPLLLTQTRVRDTFADTSQAKTELGFVPSTTLEQGLQAEAEWLSTLLGMPLR